MPELIQVSKLCFLVLAPPLSFFPLSPVGETEEIAFKSSFDAFLPRDDFKCENIPPPPEDVRALTQGTGDEHPSRRGLPLCGVDPEEALFDGGGEEG